MAWSGGYDIGDATAQLRGNGTGATAPPFTLFTADSRITSATAPELRVGFAVTRRVCDRGRRDRVAAARRRQRSPAMRKRRRRSCPAKSWSNICSTAALTWQLPIRIGRRLAPFVTGGAGYLRQLHEDRTLAETGQIYYAGGGARYWLRGGHGPVAPSACAAIRVNLRRNGIDFEDRCGTYPTFSLSCLLASDGSRGIP